MPQTDTQASTRAEENTLRLTFVGSGDIFGSGGRLQTCIAVASQSSSFLIDCGASALIGLQRCQIAPNSIDTILLTHLHGDHFAGIPFFILDAQLNSKRKDPLLIAGPIGTRQRLFTTMEALFPGLAHTQQKFSLEIKELTAEQTYVLPHLSVTPYPVEHASGAPSLALRITCAQKTITYTGDTQWTDTLIPAAQDADLLIAEAYFFEKRVKYHLDLQTLLAHRDELQARRVILTHMHQDMLARGQSAPFELAEDGKLIEL
ncbi:MBL fold metallo-hydrolase [Ktedonosporobacter rubrisoli]|uniref:MBL fold metallo-hydrolase n=1 Tax=Ktedonosporobacter rubrisoli TaxID=2509675 RepID=A0A4P6JTT7_KTERU|nr:MBL fold metallo-hydrolase [Ktedonosporobacter rubrisoli]QBD78720.1 MBL fold metallo-hydrolase [Ktedonosporobacter rubrisoli]